MKILVGILIVLLCLLQYRLWFGDANIAEVQQYKHRIEELKQQAIVFHARNEVLKAEVRDLKQGIEAIEERARQDLGMIKEGETFFQIIEPESR